jgi:hypothetical protein
MQARAILLHGSQDVMHPSNREVGSPTILNDSTLAQHRADLDSRLDRLLAATLTTEAGRKLAGGTVGTTP